MSFNNRMPKRSSIPLLEFGQPDDPVTGFMSNSSSYGFELDGVLWPSVEHFILAKRFTGTPLEESIRHADSVWKARCLSRSKMKIEVEGEWVYRRRIYADRVNAEWEANIQTYLERALTAKFSSSRLLTKLLATGEAHLVDKSDTVMAPFTGTLLERIRARARLSRSPTICGTLEFPEDDIPFSSFSPEMRELFEKILRVLIRIRIEEGQKSIYPDMIRDAIYNITPSITRDEKTLQTELISMVMATPSWSIIFVTTPNFRILVDKIKLEYSLNSEIAHLLLRFFRWLIFTSDDSPIKQVAMERLNRVADLEITLPPETRPYRGKAPPCPLLIPRSNVNMAKGDILSFSLPDRDELVWIGAIASTTSTKLRLPGESTDAIYETYPYSNLYAINTVSKGGKGYEPGSVILSRPRHATTGHIVPSSALARNVASLFCQIQPTDPSPPYDTIENRREWFHACLVEFASLFPKDTDIVLCISKSPIEHYIDILTKFSCLHMNIEFHIFEDEVVSRRALPTISTKPRIESGALDIPKITKVIAPLNLPVAIAKRAVETITDIPRDVMALPFEEKRDAILNEVVEGDSDLLQELELT